MKTLDATKKTRRIQIEMPPASTDRLETLKQITESASYAEVIRNALRLYEAVIKEVEDGSEFFIEKNGQKSKYNIFSR